MLWGKKVSIVGVLKLILLLYVYRLELFRLMNRVIMYVLRLLLVVKGILLVIKAYVIPVLQVLLGKEKKICLVIAIVLRISLRF